MESGIQAWLARLPRAFADLATPSLFYQLTVLALAGLAFNIGSSRVSMLPTIKLVALIALLLTLAFWISGVLEWRMRASAYMNPSLQVAFGKFSKFFLIGLALLLAIDAVGIDLTTLTVFGGALSVGIGFGLQRITSNFISGFILVLDRSIKPGDVISVGQNDAKYGWGQELRARYVVVRDLYLKTVPGRGAADS